MQYSKKWSKCTVFKTRGLHEQAKRKSLNSQSISSGLKGRWGSKIKINIKKRVISRMPQPAIEPS